MHFFKFIFFGFEKDGGCSFGMDSLNDLLIVIFKFAEIGAGIFYVLVDFIYHIAHGVSM